MQLVALLVGAALGAAAIPHLPQRVTREEPLQWLHIHFEFHQSLSWQVRAYQPPPEPRNVRFE